MVSYFAKEAKNWKLAALQITVSTLTRAISTACAIYSQRKKPKKKKKKFACFARLEISRFSLGPVVFGCFPARKVLRAIVLRPDYSGWSVGFTDYAQAKITRWNFIRARTTTNHESLRPRLLANLDWNGSKVVNIARTNWGDCRVLTFERRKKQKREKNSWLSRLYQFLDIKSCSKRFQFFVRRVRVRNDSTVHRCPSGTNIRVSRVNCTYFECNSI